MADRISLENTIIDNIADKMDDVHMLNLNPDNKSHPKTFTFAMAMGAGAGERTPSGSSKRGWLQYSAIKNSSSENLSYATSLALEELRKTGQDNLVSDDDELFGIATEYANSGFKIISDMVDFNEYDEDDFVQQLIALMDDKYDEIISRQEAE